MIKDIEERKYVSDSFREWFSDGWNRNKGSIDDLIGHNEQLSKDVTYLLSLVKKQREALAKIAGYNGVDLNGYECMNIAEEALKEE